MRKNETGQATKKPWPENCIWPEPADDGFFWEAEDAESLPLDEAGEELLEIKEYFDALVQCGRLNDDYSLNEDFEDGEQDDEDEEWEPEKGSDYWDDGFDIDSWEEDLTAHLNLLKLPLPSPADEVRRIIGYEFINENLLRQAFTRRSFGTEYETGDSEELELIGDAVLNTVITREMARQLTEVNVISPGKPFRSLYSEGELTRIRQHFISGEYLAARAAELGLDKLILFGSDEIKADERPSESSREDAMEALIGAVAVDCGWDWYTLEAVVDRLLCVQLGNARALSRPAFFDTFNTWHQKHFGRMPEYEVSKGSPAATGANEYSYFCTLRFSVPENEKGIRTSQRVDVRGKTRSEARELAAKEAYNFTVRHGLWINLSEAGIEPKPEDSINQLQELYQKKYVPEPSYTFTEKADGWQCVCRCESFEGWGKAPGKVKAKKKAAFMCLVRMYRSAGLSNQEMEKAMWKMAEN